MNPSLQDAVAIFKELGWENASPDNILDLPVGTAEQKRTALAGLKSGEWGQYTNEDVSLRWHSYFDVDASKLALFAVHVGVSAQRAVSLLSGENPEMLTTVIAGRGAKYSAEFIGHACVSRYRLFEHSSSAFGNAAVRLVDKLDLDIPQNAEYMKDWSVYAAVAMGLKAETRYNETDLPGSDLIKRRFDEHILTGIAVGAPATGPFGKVLLNGAKRGWLSRENSISLTFSALDASVRPGDRKVWLAVLDELNVSDEELFAHTQALIPLLATGDSAVVNRLAPVLIKLAEDDLLAEIVLAAFSVATKKGRKLVLKAALSRQRTGSAESVEKITPWLSILADDKDKDVASLATQLMKQWHISADVLPEEKTEIQGLWQETPPVWNVPPFELGEVSSEALTELAAKIVNQPAVIHDVTAERFLAMVNAVAYQNPETARSSLRGLRYSNNKIINYVVGWVKTGKPVLWFSGDKPIYDLGENDLQAPLAARDYIVTLHLGELPGLLSTPSAVDLSINVPDLAARLASYKNTGTNALEADLLLALARLDIHTQTPEAIGVLSKLDVPVVLESGQKMSVTAGHAILNYLDNPIEELSLSGVPSSYWYNTDIEISASLPGFPNRFKSYVEELYSIFPLWGDVTLGAVRWNDEVYHEQGLVLRQTARRATPLSPGVSINILAAQRSITPDAAADSLRAVTEAWERGLLRPGVADVSFLDWSTRPPSNVAALSAALDDIARDGLLSVVWPILDDLIAVSLKAPRLLAGTAELAELIASFLPEVQFAVEEGKADRNALDLPGIRVLAQRGGSSRDVNAAQKIAALLPPIQNEPSKDEKSAAVMDPPFEEVWSVREKEVLLIDDGVKVTVDWADAAAPTRIFMFTLTLPGITDRVFQVVKNWHYDLESEGQCQAYTAEPGAAAFARNDKNQVWLHWDEKKNVLVVSDKRNWIEGKDGPLVLPGVSKRIQPPLPSSLLTVIIGLLAQDGDAVYFAPWLLEKAIERGQIDEKVVRAATQTLLRNPVVSPGKLVRVLEKEIKLLPILWPMLIESVKLAGSLVAAGENPPVWVNRILSIALRYAPYLVEAVKRGHISAEDGRWAGLSEIASSRSKSAAVAKAKKLLDMIMVSD